MTPAMRPRADTLEDLVPCILAEEVDLLTEIAMQIGESGRCEPWRVANTLAKVRTLSSLLEREMVLIDEGEIVLTALGCDWAIAFSRAVLGAEVAA